MSHASSSRRTVLKRGALLGGALVPAGLAATARAQEAPRSGAAHGLFDVRDFGAKGDGLTPDTRALQGAIDACHEAGGGTVLVPSGIYLSAAFELRSRVTLHLEAGATVLGSPRLEDYPVEGEDASGESERAGLVTARDAEGVAIVGRGTIDGNALAFHDQTRSHVAPDLERRYTRQKERFLPEGAFFEHGPLAHGPRPGNLVRFFACRDVLVHGVTIQNSPTWTSHYRDCENVTIEAVRINSDASDRMVPNDDGIDLARCRDVRILGCDIDTGDDCIALFGSERVVVTSCTLSTRSVAIRVGYDTETIRDCVFSSIVIHGAHRGLGVFVRGEGSVENVVFSDIVMRTRLYTGHWWGKGEPLHVSVMPLHAGATRLGGIRGITFARIRAEAEAGAVVWGSLESRIGDVTLDDVRVHVVRGPQSETYGGNIDLRGARDLSHSLFERDLPALLAERIDRLTLRGFEVTWGDDVPALFTHAVECREFGEVEVEGFRGRQAGATGSAVLLADGGDVVIRDSRATAGTDVFVAASDVSGRVVLRDNDLRAAATPASPAELGRRDREG